MSRLSKKDITIVIDNELSFVLPRVTGKKLTAQILNEMFEYKTIEEELGIDLITLFKTLTNGVYHKTKNDIVYYTPTNLQIMKRKEWYLYHLSYTHLKLKDYGIIWSLNKEDLL